MERGLLWLPLLGVFSWLAWSGWNEYQKIEAYRVWAKQFQHSKYDIYAALGQNGTHLAWGKPTRQGPINLETLDLKKVRSLQLRVDGQSVDLANPPSQGRKITLVFELSEQVPDQGSDQGSGVAKAVEIPFTEIPLAVEWGQRLQQELQIS